MNKTQEESIQEETGQLDEPFHEEGEIDLNLKNKISLRGHQWVQKGPWIKCRSCPLEHGSYIGIQHELRGIDEEGLPILAKRA